LLVLPAAVLAFAGGLTLDLGAARDAQAPAAATTAVSARCAAGDRSP
jgi:hypothetical protein